MSLYHETAEILSIPSSAGGSLRSRVFGKKDLKTSPQQVYALAAESCKWSAILKEVIENADILSIERKLTPCLALLLVHDLLLTKGGIALPSSHGLRTTAERHKARLTAELTRARLRRKAPSIDILRQQVETTHAETYSLHPRWVRINTLLSSLEAQLESTFKDFKRVHAVKEVIPSGGKALFLDAHIPNLVAISPGFEITKTDAYKSGKIILQDKASCFPAYLLDPHVEDGDIIDSCAAPGNKTTHLASIVHSRTPEQGDGQLQIFAFERSAPRAKTLESMVKLAGGNNIIQVNPRHDFLKVDPEASRYRNVGCLLLDPSCSGSGIVNRDGAPVIHLPEPKGSTINKPGEDQGRKRKREVKGPGPEPEPDAKVLIDDDGQQTVVSSEQELNVRLDTLASFQLMLLLHALKFPSAKKVTYSTCSIHAQENEQVVLKALQSDVAKARGWRMLPRDRQVRGMKDWPVRGSVEAADGDQHVADACIRSYKDDGLGVMGFFVAAFTRDVQQYAPDDDGPYQRDSSGRIFRDLLGMPVSKADPKSDPSVAGQDPSESQTADGGHEVAATDGDKSAGDDAGEDEWGGFED